MILVKLRNNRLALGLSQAGLSSLLGVPVNTIARWERGELAIAHPRILELALIHLTKCAPGPRD